MAEAAEVGKARTVVEKDAQSIIILVMALVEVWGPCGLYGGLDELSQTQTQAICKSIYDSTRRNPATKTNYLQSM